jgi:hypothetical protein
MPDIPTNEPAQLRLGDTWQWRREDLAGDYPAPTWTLTYRFKNAAGGFEIIASADGSNFAVNVTAATTAAYASGAGTYAWVAQVSHGDGRKFTVDNGSLDVLPNLFSGSATAASDQRTHSEKALDAIKAVIEGRASRDQEEYTIAGRSLKRTPIADLLKLLNFYETRVAAERNAEAIRNGRGVGGHIQVRM